MGFFPMAGLRQEGLRLCNSFFGVDQKKGPEDCNPPDPAALEWTTHAGKRNPAGSPLLNARGFYVKLIRHHFDFT